MSNTRFSAIDILLNRSPIDLPYQDKPTPKVSTIFGENVFNDKAMQKYLSKAAYKKVKLAIDSGAKLDLKLAGIVATAMQKWAMDKGVTHFAHWFQPLTGRTAEKHDSFFDLEPLDDQVIERFSAKDLAQQEPDGSSFPGGGLRTTFEARGYTAWDPSSPAFIYEVGEGKTLCIPTIFVTYSGESLDYKLPLLKSKAYLEKAALPVVQLFDKKAKKIITTLGWEQEFFVVDEALFNARPDLMATGRTLLGKASSKGQMLDDHYFGSIPSRIFTFMRDLEMECYKLGIPVRTRHNEVAPSQFEFAPVFEEVNLAVDHNQLLMDLMERVAERHKLRVLLHEKPFKDVNGSGKHNNWSMATDTGINLLSPGGAPGKNLRFLTFFVNTIKAVYDYADLLRATVASASNDHRLGAQEAPPAIISIFVGSQLTEVLDNIMKGKSSSDNVLKVMELMERLPDLSLDTTDRNRTSPFAFTGNKFEIRMVGSSMNCAAPMLALNTMVGKQLTAFYDDLQKLLAKGMKQDEAILSLLAKYLKASKNILFEGNNYSVEWQKEAEKRGLSNNPATPDALKAFKALKVKRLFGESGVFSNRELQAHYNTMMENYISRLTIESTKLSHLCYEYVLPTAVLQQNVLAENIASLKKVGIRASGVKAQMDILKKLSAATNKIYANIQKLEKLKSRKHGSEEKRAELCKTQIKPLMEDIRVQAEIIEFFVDDNLWGLPKYRELLFLR
ncbi:MAG TPA: glutamine synthetase type III [Saprospiraceae bacterium]|nr:glutamine synthetase type III [Saprospiraceae bacterium]